MKKDEIEKEKIRGLVYGLIWSYGVDLSKQ